MTRIPFFHLRAAACVLGFVSLLPLASPANDWPRYLGSGGNTPPAEKGFSTKPKPLWKKEVGMGSGSFAIDGNHGFVMGHDGDNVVVTCFDTSTGDTIWAESFFGPGKKNNFPGGKTPFLGGPNATPTVDGDRVYTMTRFGHVHCWNAADGKKIWELKFADKFPGYKLPEWGFAASVLVAFGYAIVEPGAPGAATVCLDKLTGEVIWKTGNQNAGYATPSLETFESREMPTLLSFDREGLTGRDVERGNILWSYPWKTNYGVNATTPVPLGNDQIFISSGYGAGCAVVEIKGGKLREVWRNKAMKVKHGNPVFHEGFLYGFDEGDLVCLDPETGETRWTHEGLGKGALTLADGKLIIQAENCELVFAKATPDRYDEISRTEKLFGRHSWTRPVLSAGKIFTRNIAGSVVCLE